MKKSVIGIFAASALLLLAACGSDTQTSAVDNSTARGTLVSNPPLRIASADATKFKELLSATPSGMQLLQITGDPVCGVDFHYIQYWTIGGASEAASASGALMVPTGGAGCSGARPILLYAHGTDTDKNLNLADITDTSNTEGALIAAMFAAHGYIVVAPNYTGYDTSSLPYHPYLNAAAQSADMIDALVAARKALGHVSASSTTDGGKLFITGYSQGGYVAMATHKAMQAANMPVTASAPMSGPYALEAFSDAVFFGKVNLGSTIFTPLLTTSYQKSYGGMYTATSDVYEAAFAPTAEGLLPNTLPIDQLISTGKLPQLALFTNTPAATGNATLDAVLAPSTDPLFSLGYGTPNLLTQSFRVSYLLDALAHPDGAVPTPTNLLPSATAALPFRQKLALNDLRSWVPTAPVLMCGGHQDPVVFYTVNTIVMENFWTLVAPAPPGLVNKVDVDPSPNAPANLIQGGFAQAEAQIFAAKGQAGVVQTYHSTVAPFCSAAVRGFFDSLQAAT